MRSISRGIIAIIVAFAAASAISAIAEERSAVGHCFRSYHNASSNRIYVGCASKGNTIGVDRIVVLDGSGVYLGSHVFDRSFMPAPVSSAFAATFSLTASGDQVWLFEQRGDGMLRGIVLEVHEADEHDIALAFDRRDFEVNSINFNSAQQVIVGWQISERNELIGRVLDADGVRDVVLDDVNNIDPVAVLGGEDNRFLIGRNGSSEGATTGRVFVSTDGELFRMAYTIRNLAGFQQAYLATNGELLVVSREMRGRPVDGGTRYEIVTQLSRSQQRLQALSPSQNVSELVLEDLAEFDSHIEILGEPCTGEFLIRSLSRISLIEFQNGEFSERRLVALPNSDRVLAGFLADRMEVYQIELDSGGRPQHSSFVSLTC